MRTVKKEVLVIEECGQTWKKRKEIREYKIIHEDRESFLCQICEVDHYPDCLNYCAGGGRTYDLYCNKPGH